MLSLLQQQPTVARADLGVTFAATYAIPAVTVAGAVPPAAVAVPGAKTAPTVARADLGSALAAANVVPAVTVFGIVPPAAGAVARAVAAPTVTRADLGGAFAGANPVAVEYVQNVLICLKFEVTKHFHHTIKASAFILFAILDRIACSSRLFACLWHSLQ